ncbi:MAG: V-type ATP synthase subunit A, partial [Peptococcaceae bacterium]|nr:V-type ATP synthase subunit A [Peptococcaceae bacterium]
DDRTASLSAIGAVSPPGGDISEPVSQGTLRIVKVFWGLDANLAYARHFPSINWLNSYSLYEDRLSGWFNEHVDKDFMTQRAETMNLLQLESELNEIVRLVGIDALSPMDRLTMETARMVREDFLQQNAFIDTDAYTSFGKQFKLLRMILEFQHLGQAALTAGADMNALFSITARDRISRAKDVDQAEYEQIYADITSEMTAQIDALVEAGGDAQ